MPTWEELIADSNHNGEDVQAPGDDDVTLVSKAQHRLDEELKASGYSKEDAARDSELAYYEAHQNLNRDLNVIDDEEDEDDSEEEGGDDDFR